MRLREFLFGTALMSLALVTTKASAPAAPGDECRPDFADDAPSIAEARTRVTTPSTPSPLISQDKVLGSAYYDTLNILSSHNPCSDFFGGPASVDIFNQLVSRIQKGVLSVGIGMSMSGPTTNIHDVRSNTKYRIFDKVVLNSKGPFYQKKHAPWETIVPGVGTFQPNTKEARVLMLLHELGHVMKGSDGRWLLPDDGKDTGLSRANSFKVEDVCEDEINSLGKVATMKDLGKYKKPVQQPTPLNKNEGTQP